MRILVFGAGVIGCNLEPVPRGKGRYPASARRLGGGDSEERSADKGQVFAAHVGHPHPGGDGANGFYDVQKYLSLSGHFYSTALFIVNPDFWASLPAEYQEIIQAASEECRDYDRQLSSDSEADMIQTCKDNGMEVNEIDAEAFKSAMDSVWALYTDKYGTDAVNLALTSSGQEPLA